MKRVVISSNTAWTVFNHRAGLIETLKGLGYEVHTVAPAANFTSIKNPGTVFHEVKNLERKGKNPFSDLFLILEYYKIYKKIKPDMVFTYTIKTNIYSAIACRLAGIRIACTVNGLGTAFDNPSGMTYRIVKQLYKWAFRKAFAVIFQNPDDRQFFIDEKIIGDRNVYLVNGSGADLKKFDFSPVPDNRKFMLISRMLKNKGINEFIEAAGRLKREFSDSEFVLLGPADNDNPMGVKLSELEALDPEKGAYYGGQTKDVRPYIASCSAVVLPSYYREGIPKILIESLAVGRPVITTDRPGCRETVADGVNGYITEAGSAEDLYQVLKKYILLSHGERLEMGRASRALAEEKFDEKKVISVYLEILKK